jgi:hypothetical protein
MVVDTDRMDGFGDALVASCMVHVHRAPCPRDGEPAYPGALHAFTGRDWEGSVRMWWERTRGRRPLLVHRGDPSDDPGHDLAYGCWCRPETLPAVPS